MFQTSGKFNFHYKFFFKKQADFVFFTSKNKYKTICTSSKQVKIYFGSHFTLNMLCIKSRHVAYMCVCIEAMFHRFPVHRYRVAYLLVFYRLYFGECAHDLHQLITFPSFSHRAFRLTADYHLHLVDIPFRSTKQFLSPLTRIMHTIRIEFPACVCVSQHIPLTR